MQHRPRFEHDLCQPEQAHEVFDSVLLQIDPPLDLAPYTEAISAGEGVLGNKYAKETPFLGLGAKRMMRTR
eukprot:3462249-Rhodomonas_salina.1